MLSSSDLLLEGSPIALESKLCILLGCSMSGITRRTVSSEPINSNTKYGLRTSNNIRAVTGFGVGVS